MRRADHCKMALQDIVVLAVLLSCLLVLHQVMEAMITDYIYILVYTSRDGGQSLNLLMLRERDTLERTDVPANFGSGQDEHVYGGVIS